LPIILVLTGKRLKIFTKKLSRTDRPIKIFRYPVLLAVDQIAVKKRHRYLTVIINIVRKIDLKVVFHEQLNGRRVIGISYKKLP
jgi:hypothetical protein